MAFNLFFQLFSEEVEHCRAWSNNYTQQIDLAFNMFFMVYYFIRVSGIINFYNAIMLKLNGKETKVSGK